MIALCRLGWAWLLACLAGRLTVLSWRIMRIAVRLRRVAMVWALRAGLTEAEAAALRAASLRDSWRSH